MRMRFTAHHLHLYPTRYRKLWEMKQSLCVVMDDMRQDRKILVDHFKPTDTQTALVNLSGSHRKMSRQEWGREISGERKKLTWVGRRWDGIVASL